MDVKVYYGSVNKNYYVTFGEFDSMLHDGKLLNIAGKWICADDSVKPKE